MSARVVTKTILIDGMTCVNCENRIERKLSGTAGIESARVSFSKGTAAISYDTDIISLIQIEEIIENLGYKIKRPQELAKSSSNFNIMNLLGIGIIILALYMILNRLRVLQIFNSFPVAKEGMGYGMLFVIGLFTSVHCVAMCGGICLTQCVPKKAGEDDSRNKLSALKPSVLYNLGRMISYTVIGGIVGALGSVISFSGSLKGIVQIAAGVFMVIMGLNMLNVFPWLKRFNLRMPKIFARKINDQKKNRNPLYVGLLNGLMPCGPLQAMQLYALSTGSPLKGAFAMFLFSIGTVPLMLAFGALSSLLSRKFTAKMMKAGAVLVVVLGVFMFGNGVSLSGFSIPTAIGSTNSSKIGNVAVIKDGVQTVTTDLSSGRYEPITVQKGIPVKWTVKAEKGDINGCNNSIVIPKYDMTYNFKLGDNLIEFTPEESGIVGYSCWMGMIRSRITVVDDISTVNGNTDSGNNGNTGNNGITGDSGDTDDTGITGNTDGTGQSGTNGLDNVGQILDVKIPTDNVAIAEIKDDIQEVEINVEDTRFSPAVIVVQRDLETIWTMKTTSLNESNETLLFPYYSTSLPMEEGGNSIYFIPDNDFDFSAVDYSFFGYVKVVDDINNIDLEAIKKEVDEFAPTIQEFDSTGGSGASCH